MKLDLLYPSPQPRLDQERLERVVGFVYAAGGTGGALGEALASTTAPPTAYDPSCFSKDIFLGEFVKSLFRISLNGKVYPAELNYTCQILASPPGDDAVIDYRGEIIEELIAEEAERARLSDLYLSLAALRKLLEGADPSNPASSVRRRLELLELIKSIVTLMEGFVGCRSGLKGLALWAEAERARPEFRRLAELLDFEANLSLVDLRVQVGVDGRLRGFDVVALKENVKSQYYLSPWKRIWDRLSLWLRGYRFGEHELMSRLVDWVFSEFEAEVAELLKLSLDIGVYLGMLDFRDRAERLGLSLSRAELVPFGQGSQIERLFNPLLLASDIKPIPCDLAFGGEQCVSVITGPNSGGKTRLLQSLALTQLLGEGGWLVPCARASLERSGALFVSLIEEPCMDQQEGRLGSELMRIRRVFEHAQPGALVLLDELCSGTNPSEGEELFELVVELFFELRPRAFVTTHFLGLAERLYGAGFGERLGFFQVELDEHNAPTFAFVQGVASTSLAQETASRLGVTRDELRALIRRQSRA